ncbi:protein kinase [Streptosporangium sp. NPDC087985]|uniref:protein kinase domain-containing protein n=1 Tax=Streptosporangium sp. NPDC087985 TaxID=3366196 RepID=UPI0038189E55
MPSRRPLDPGDPERIGDYLLTGVLGEGGQGIVYRARTPTGTSVAIKVLHARMAADPDAGRRLLREADIARRIAPFCTARVLDMGLFADRPYIVSEHIPGIALDTLVNSDGPRTGSGLHRLAVATLTSLAAIHRAGIVHRDFKPGNVILGPEGPVVIDFGISRVLEHLTTRSGPVGTPAYMAPEQFEQQPAGPAADVFGWAATMVFAATGHLAFPGSTLPAVMHAILTGEPDLDGVPEDLRPLLKTCLEKRPDARPGAADLLRRLTNDDQPGLPAARRSSRRRLLLGGLTALTAAGIIAAVPSWLHAPEGTHSTAPGPTDSPTPVGSALGKPLTGHTATVTSVAVGQLGGKPIAVSGGDDSTVRVWDLAAGKQLGQPLTGHGNAVTSVAVSRSDGRSIAVSGSYDGTVRVWDLAAGKQLGQPLTGHGDIVWSVALGELAGKSVAVSGGSDGAVRVWDLAAGKQSGQPLTGQGAAVWSVALGQLGGKPIVVSVGYDGTVLVRDLLTRKQIGKSLTGPTTTTTSVTLGELEGRSVAVSGGSDGTVRVWDLAAGKQLGQPLTGHGDTVWSVALGELEGKSVAVSGGSDGAVRVWDLAAGKQLGQPLTGHGDAVTSVALGQLDGETIAVAGGSDGRLHTWGLGLPGPPPRPR